MGLIAPNAAEQVLLSYIVSNQGGTGQVLHLYGGPTGGSVGDITPSSSSTLGTFTTVELTGVSLYAPITLTYASWGITQGTDSVYTATYPEVTFSFGAGINVYGYYISDYGTSNLLWCERFAGAPFTMPTSGGTIAILPKLTLN